jgi:hypothetical protein
MKRVFYRTSESEDGWGGFSSPMGALPGAAQCNSQVKAHAAWRCHAGRLCSLPKEVDPQPHTREPGSHLNQGHFQKAADFPAGTPLPGPEKRPM